MNQPQNDCKNPECSNGWHQPDGAKEPIPCQECNSTHHDKLKHTSSYNKVADAMQIIETEMKNGAFTSSEVHAINLFSNVIGRATGNVLKAMIKAAEKN